MKFYFCFLYTLFNKIRYSHRIFNFTLNGGLFSGCIVCKEDNSVSFGKADVLSTIIEIKGTKNTFVSDAHMQRVNVRIEGTNNNVTISEGVKFLNAKVFVKGNDCKLFIGKNTTFGDGLSLVCMGANNSILIGEECMIADNVDIWSSDTHPIFDENNSIINKSKNVVVSNHVWIGKNVNILKGVTIGENAIIGMGSIVTKDVENNSLNVGNPSRCIKQGVNWDRKHIVE